MVHMADPAEARQGGVRAAVPGEPSQGRVGGALESTCCRRRQLQAEGARSTVGLRGPRAHTLTTTVDRRRFDTVGGVRTRTSSAWLYRPCDVDGAEWRGPTSSGPADWADRPGRLLVLQWIDRVPRGVRWEARGRGRPDTCVAGSAPGRQFFARRTSEIGF